MCKKIYIQTHHTQKYCSDQCRYEAILLSNKKSKEKQRNKHKIEKKQRAIDDKNIRKNYAEYQKQQTIAMIRKGEL